MSVALLFSPQGSQAVGMGRELSIASPEARAVFDAADAALGWSVSELAWHGPEERLNDTRWTQPALLTTSVAALAALEARVDPMPAFVAGHSVGEYAALVAAGVLDFEQALRLVARRGELMAARGNGGGMAAVMGLDRGVVQDTLDSVTSPTAVVVANDNAPGQVVVSGTEDGLAVAEEALRQAGARRFIRLNVSGPFHSPHMADLCDALAAAFDAVSWADARIPLISNVTAKPETDSDRLRNLLAEQVRSPVEWVASVRRMAADGVETYVEFGAGTALAGMVRRIVPEAAVLAVNDRATLNETVEALSRAAAPAGASV